MWILPFKSVRPLVIRSASGSSERGRRRAPSPCSWEHQLRGIRLVAIANRTLEHGERAFREAGITEWRRPESARDAETAIARGLPVLTDDPSVLTNCDAIDVLVEATGTIEPAACVVVDAIDHGKHVVLVNAELDSLLGPILKAKADRAGVVITHTDGEEPGVAMTLLRYLRSVGFRPVAAGNLKGMVDHYRTPETQRGFAEKYDQDVRKVTSFADATKLSMETTVLANATGFHAGRRGMYGPACAARPGDGQPPARRPDARHRPGRLCARRCAAHRRLRHRSRGLAAQEGSAWRTTNSAMVRSTSFTRPIICLISRSPRPSVARPSIAIRPSLLSAARFAKWSRLPSVDLKAGERLDGIGGFCAYGLIDNSTAARAMAALPISLAEDCVLRRDVAKDEVLSFDDVDQPARGVVDGLWREQMARWPQAKRAAEK